MEKICFDMSELWLVCGAEVRGRNNAWGEHLIFFFFFKFHNDKSLQRWSAQSSSVKNTNFICHLLNFTNMPSWMINIRQSGWLIKASLSFNIIQSDLFVFTMLSVRVWKSLTSFKVTAKETALCFMQEKHHDGVDLDKS